MKKRKVSNNHQRAVAVVESESTSNSTFEKKKNHL